MLQPVDDNFNPLIQILQQRDSQDSWFCLLEYYAVFGNDNIYGMPA